MAVAVGRVCVCVCGKVDRSKCAVLDSRSAGGLRFGWFRNP